MHLRLFRLVCITVYCGLLWYTPDFYPSEAVSRIERMKKSQWLLRDLSGYGLAFGLDLEHTSGISKKTLAEPWDHRVGQWDQRALSKVADASSQQGSRCKKQRGEAHSILLFIPSREFTDHPCHHPLVVLHQPVWIVQTASKQLSINLELSSHTQIQGPSLCVAVLVGLIDREVGFKDHFPKRSLSNVELSLFRGPWSSVSERVCCGARS